MTDELKTETEREVSLVSTLYTSTSGRHTLLLSVSERNELAYSSRNWKRTIRFNSRSSVLRLITQSLRSNVPTGFPTYWGRIWAGFYNYHKRNSLGTMSSFSFKFIQIVAMIFIDMSQISLKNPWPEFAGELYRPQLVGKVSANFCG
jgi:hypothetical protein